MDRFWSAGKVQMRRGRPRHKNLQRHRNGVRSEDEGLIEEAIEGKERLGSKR